LSGDEISFGEVTYRQPQRRLRPDLDRRWACLAYQVPGPDDLPIFLDFKTADAIERHALSDTTVELGGILLGHECRDEQTGQPFVWITQALEAKYYENTEASFTYTHDSWEEMSRERGQRFPDLDVVGWYHTHPDFGIFLSGHDQFLHRHFFGQPLQVAYVVDPIRQTRGFFQWRDATVEPVGGFYLTAERGERIALARFVHDLENFPDPPASGSGGLSPRLEAELIAMLKRPLSASAAAVDRTQTAAVFGLLGAVLGVLGLAAVLWLNTLSHQIQDQAAALQALQAAWAQAAEAHRGDVAAARVEAKEAALDALLHQVRAGDSAEQFTQLYEQAVRQRDEARRELRRQLTNQEGLHALNEQLRAALNAANQKAAELELKLKEDQQLRDDVNELRQQLKARDAKMADTAIFRKYDWAWYAAVGGGVVSLLLALALANISLRTRPVAEPETRPSHPI
jgi:proteasome lid subunit RPN8/RPN11